jgi:protein-tyrosine-phosphatase
MIVFVDINDTFRAAAAARYYEAKTGLPAAHAGVFSEKGIPSGAIAQQAAREWGIDLTDARSVPAERALLAQAERICAVTAAIAARLAEDYPEYASKITAIELPDPFGMGKQAYLDCLDAMRIQLEGWK